VASVAENQIKNHKTEGRKREREKKRNQGKGGGKGAWILMSGQGGKKGYKVQYLLLWGGKTNKGGPGVRKRWPGRGGKVGQFKLSELYPSTSTQGASFQKASAKLK